MSEKIASRATIEQTNYITELEAGEFSFRADEPIDIGGSGVAPTPFDYLYSALASCVAITLKMYVDRKGWDVGSIQVNIIPKESENGEVVLHKQIVTSKEVKKDQKKRMLLIADKCPVAKLLKQGVEQSVMF